MVPSAVFWTIASSSTVFVLWVEADAMRGLRTSAAPAASPPTNTSRPRVFPFLGERAMRKCPNMRVLSTGVVLSHGLTDERAARIPLRQLAAQLGIRGPILDAARSLPADAQLGSVAGSRR